MRWSRQFCSASDSTSFSKNKSEPRKQARTNSYRLVYSRSDSATPHLLVLRSAPRLNPRLDATAGAQRCDMLDERRAGSIHSTGYPPHGAWTENGGDPRKQQRRSDIPHQDHRGRIDGVEQ